MSLSRAWVSLAIALAGCHRLLPFSPGVQPGLDEGARLDQSLLADAMTPPVDGADRGGARPDLRQPIICGNVGAKEESDAAIWRVVLP